MCVFRDWHETTTRTIREDKPLTVYKVLRFENGRLYSPVQDDNIWREGEFHLKRVDGARWDWGSGSWKTSHWSPGIHCMKKQRDCEEWERSNTVVVQMKVWGIVKRYEESTLSYNVRYGYKKPMIGYLVQHARVVGIVKGPQYERYQSYYWSPGTLQKRFEARLQKLLEKHPHIQDMRSGKKVAA
jgi:hypothetical protein